MSTTAIATKTRIEREPGRRVSLGRLLSVNAMWLGQGAHWPPITFSLLPAAALMITGTTAASALLIGRVSAAGNLFALLAPILAGWLSDRTRSRWGRRRPWLVAGTAVNLVGLAALALAGTPLVVAIAYMLVQLSFNLAGGAYAAVIPDVVPAHERGRASGMLGMMNVVGSVAGLAGVIAALTFLGENHTGIVAGYGVVIAVLSITTIITVVAIEEPPAPAARPEPFALSPLGVVAVAAGSIAGLAWLGFNLLPLDGWTWAIVIAGAVGVAVAVFSAARVPAMREFFAAFRNRDFFWTFATRAFVIMGINTILPFLALYFRDVVGVNDPGTMSGLWGLAVLAGAIVPAIVGGHFSDRLGRRKLFVYISGGAQALVASVLLFGLVQSLPVIFAMGVVFGMGYGMYYAVDWAIACDVLPDRERSGGRDMGLWHIAFTLPTALAPAIFAPLLNAFNEPNHLVLGMATGNHLGFRLVFAGAAFWFVLGTVFVQRIRAVR
ncbi:MAG TPA: MFS transporter [Candidatus Dormibacteraeota bacterium]|nr:MFS transporter [Candidatus Dormibacteraeota bacterium]